MPELAEVAWYARQWDAGRGREILRVDLHPRTRVFRACDPSELEEGLAGAKLMDARTHGKQMLFQFTKGQWLTLHLGMTGDLSTKPQPHEPARHEHLVLHTRTVALVFSDPRQFGSIQHHVGKETPPAWRNLPPQPTDPGFSVPLLRGALQRHARTPLKALLLDQRWFPGVGNWMADEVLWQMKLPPHVLAGSLDEKRVRALHRTVRKVCDVALKTIGEDWSDPPLNWLFRYRWEDGHCCPRCEAELVRETVRGRTACWCPVCQRVEQITASPSPAGCRTASPS